MVCSIVDKLKVYVLFVLIYFVCVFSASLAPVISITEAGTENGREPHLELHSDSKVCV